MDQEGTVVYFETSPSAAQLKQINANQDIFEEDVYSDRPVQWTTNSSIAAEIKANNPQFSTLWNFLIDIKSKLREWLHFNSDLQVDFQDKVVTHIINSPLLTEQDFQLLHISFTSDSKDCSQHIQTKVQRTSINSTFFYTTLLCSIVIAFIAVSWMLTPLLPVVILMVALCILLLARVLNSWTVSIMTENFNRLKTYTSQFDSLLSLLTQSIRVIQETEILAHGFSRPSGTVPIGRMERQSSQLQCVSLRRRVFEVCQSGVLLSRRMTETLCVGHPLTEELDERCGYLAFRPLSNLHQFMSDTKEERDETTSLKLESLKDACNLLAVQNSELLRRLALVIGLNRHPCNNTTATATKKKQSHHHLIAVLQHLKQPLKHVESSCNDLQWSLDFHRNSLFGEPPSRAVVEKKNDSTLPLQPVADEVHCMDLKTQYTLERIREMGEKLLLANVDIKNIREQLVLIQHNLEGITDHVTDSLDLLDKLEHSTDDESSQHSRSPQLDSLETKEDISLTHFEQLSTNEECPSDDEVVYEAYVPTTGGDEDHDKESLWDQLNEEEREQLEKQQKEAKEVPLRMLKELNSVLAIRNTEKEKRRSEKRKKRNQQPLEDLVTSIEDNTTTSDHIVTSDMLQLSTTTSHNLQTTHSNMEPSPSCSNVSDSFKPSAPTPQCHSLQAKESGSHFETDSADVNEGRDSLGYSAIAEAVAAAAVLRSNRNIESEVFVHEADDDDSQEEN